MSILQEGERTEVGRSPVSLALGDLAPAHRRPTAAERAPRSALGVVGLLGVALGAFILRVLFVGQQSAYMDENTNILIGRYLIERHATYASALEWSYGSYLWAFVAGAADIAGGLSLVRTVTAVLGAAMALATGLAAAWLAPPAVSATRRWILAIVAGLLMALAPTAIAIGRFATYDALAGTGFMLGIAALAAAQRSGRWIALPLAATAMFVAFLSKYVVAIYFPFICLYLLLSPRSRATLARNLTGFVVPLSAACGVYFLLYRGQLLVLLSFSTEYSDLKSATPLREYVWQRPEIWALVALAALGWRRATTFSRIIALGGTAILLGFQAFSRADHDFWKHSIYVVFFLSPLAALALASPAEWLLATIGATGTHTARRRALALAVALLGPLTGAGLLVGFRALATRVDISAVTRWSTLAIALFAVLAIVLAPLVEMHGWRVGGGARTALVALAATLLFGPVAAAALVESSRLVTFYPNLNPSLEAIRAHTAQASTILTDDSAIRYYLYPRSDLVTDPFFMVYKGQRGTEAYRQAIGERHFDRIVLTGGIGPIGGQFKTEHGQLIAQNYERVYANDGRDGAPVEIYRPLESDLTPPDTRSVVYRFDDDIQGWGARLGDAEVQPGRQVALDRDRTWDGNASLRFDITPDVSTIGVRPPGPVGKVMAWVYVTGTPGVDTEVPVGIIGFDANWQWHDDGFGQTVAVGRWTKITWALSEPGRYNEIGLHFPPEAAGRTIYLGQVEVQP